MRPVMAMITDRARFGAHWESATAMRVGAAARAGVHLVLVREPDLDARALTSLVAACLTAVHGTRTRIIVNDRLDVALTAGAHGVHLRADSVHAVRVKSLVPPSFLIGRSVHARDEAERVVDQGALDYLLFGTVFESASKPDVVPAGRSGLAEVTASTQLPVLAVGGMTPATVQGLGSTGAAGFAAIGLFADAPLDQVLTLVRQASVAFGAPS